VWLSLRDLLFAVNRSVTVLVITCPHALGLAIPLVIVSATALAAKNGILVRNREALERAKDIKTVAFDKTSDPAPTKGARERASKGRSRKENLGYRIFIRKV
jgi:Cu2+-exporting ATPase